MTQCTKASHGLKTDLSTGIWHQQHADLIAKSELDLGYRVVSVELC